MKKLFMSFLFAFGLSASVMSQGIEFETGGFDATLAKAKSNNKVVFIDFYTTWCGPCKSMSKNVFPNQEVGDVFNRNFYSLKLDAEKEGKSLASKYAINAYPTLVFINSNGEMIHKVVGGISPEELIVEAKKAIEQSNDPNNYAAMQKLLPTKQNDPEFLRKYIDKSIEYGSLRCETIDQYLSIQKSMKESGAKMMEFMLGAGKYILCGTHSADVFFRNLDSYKDIATRVEVNDLNKITQNILKTSHDKAIATSNIQLYNKYLTTWCSLTNKSPFDFYNAKKLELYKLEKKNKEYVKLYSQFADSLTTTMSVADIKAKDQTHYERESKKIGTGILADAMKEGHRNVIASNICYNVGSYGGYYLSCTKSKADRKKLHNWIDFCNQLLPEYFSTMNLEANLLYVDGKKEQAIEKKKQVLEITKRNKAISAQIQKELALMESGKKLF